MLQSGRFNSHLVAALLLLFSLGLAFANEVKGKVVGVHDGDSLTLLTEGSVEIKVRLEGIDAPELKQDFGTASKKALSDMVYGKEVRLAETGKDRYGRTLGNIYVGKIWVNIAMIEQGMAWFYRQYSSSKPLAAAEATAREIQVGLWRDKEPVSPWDSRKKKQQTKRN
jgi:endonuclease YncB( thermonuclease family)